MLQQDDIWDRFDCLQWPGGRTRRTPHHPHRPDIQRQYRRIKSCTETMDEMLAEPLGMCARTQEKTTMADEYGQLTDAQIVAPTALVEGATITAAAEAANVARVAANRPLKPTNRSGHSVHYQTNINDDIEGRQ